MDACHRPALASKVGFLFSACPWRLVESSSLLAFYLSTKLRDCPVDSYRPGCVGGPQVSM